jgi:hypothetical protein
MCNVLVLDRASVPVILKVSAVVKASCRNVPKPGIKSQDVPIREHTSISFRS